MSHRPTLVRVGTAAPRIPVGYLVTRVQRGRIVLGAGTLLTAAATLTATATSIPVLQVGAFALGLTAHSLFRALDAYVLEEIPDDRGSTV